LARAARLGYDVSSGGKRTMTLGLTSILLWNFLADVIYNHTTMETASTFDAFGLIYCLLLFLLWEIADLYTAGLCFGVLII